MSLLPTIKEEGGLTWFQKILRYRLQFQLMIPASMVFFAGGLKLGWSIYESPPEYFDYDHNTDFLKLSWFIGASVGAVIGSLFVGRVTKNIAHLSSGALLIVGGILFITLPNVFIAVLMSCLCEGISMGLMQVQTFTSGGELASKEIRGCIMSTERCFLWLGILMQLTFTYFWYELEPVRGHTLQPDQIHGLVVACLGLVTIIATLKQSTESPIMLLQQQRELAVIAVLNKLTGDHLAPSDVTRMRKDCLELVAADAEQSGFYIFRKRNAKPLMKVFVLRCFVTLAMSQPFNQLFMSASWYGFHCKSNCMYIMPFIGFIGSLLGSLAVDRYGRRRMCVSSLLPAMVFMLIAGGIMASLANAEIALIRIDVEIVALLILLFQFIICIGVSIAASAYLAEAFTVTQKSKCIACILCGEYSLQIALVLISSTMTTNAVVFYFAMGFFCLVFGVSVFFCMPETKCLTLNECLEKFKCLHSS